MKISVWQSRTRGAWLALFAAMSTVALAATAKFVYEDPAALYLDPTRPTQERISDLLSRMTLTQKLSLLDETMNEIPGISPRYHVGNEALHGVVRPAKATIFPQAIALASSWNVALHEQIAIAISDEARAMHNIFDGQEPKYGGLLTFFSPTVNMARDPRWGRTPETYGEDPYLTGRLGVAYVKGMQGNDPKYLKVATTVKHFAANNQEQDREKLSAAIPERVLHEYFLPAFRDVVMEGGATAVMSAYNAINGVPATANNYLLNDLLRGEWGFKGYVVSDCGAVGNLYTQHKWARNYVEAAAMALNAGVDLECGEEVMKNNLAAALDDGKVSAERIDEAVRRVLTTRFRLGMYDNKALVPYSKLPPETIGSPAHQALARQSAREGIVLLKNDPVAGEPLLPINPKKVKRITVLGPHADTMVYGDYSNEAGPANEPVTPLGGLKERLAAQHVELSYVRYYLDTYAVVPASNVYHPDDPNQRGWKGEYFQNSNLAGDPSHTRIDQVIDFNKNNKPDAHFPERGGADEGFSVRWRGRVIPEVSGRYILSFTNDDGVRVYVDGALVIDDWHDGSSRRNTHDLDMEAHHAYDVKIEFYDKGGLAIAKFEWQEPIGDLTELAQTAARNSDLVVAFMGANAEREHEGLDREDIAFYEDQSEYLSKIATANANIILVMVNGGPIAINTKQATIPAIVETWFSGEQGGHAIADVLLGAYNPAGRMPLTTYKSKNDLWPMNDYDITKGRTYQYFKGEVLYPFGYGLSYTTFTYSHLKLSNKEVGPDGSIDIGVEVSNSGARAGDEVVQLYIHDRGAGVIRPLKVLRGFSRIHLLPGETKQVVFNLKYRDLAFYDVDTKRFLTQPGLFDVMIGASSADIKLSAVLSAF